MKTERKWKDIIQFKNFSLIVMHELEYLLFADVIDGILRRERLSKYLKLPPLWLKHK